MGWGVGFNIPPFAPSLTFCEPLQSGVMCLKLAGEQKFKQWSEGFFITPDCCASFPFFSPALSGIASLHLIPLEKGRWEIKL